MYNNKLKTIINDKMFDKYACISSQKVLNTCGFGIPVNIAY